MKVQIEFIKDFASKSKGDVGMYDSMLSRSLIDRKIAKPFEKKEAKKLEKKVTTKK